MRSRRAPSYEGLSPASERASKAARGSSRKQDTKCEAKLRKALWARGYRYRKNAPGLPGRPDIVFHAARVVVFCDGDFWHGRHWESRKEKLRAGHNPTYWVEKIQRNIDRDAEQTRALEASGWTVLRFWEGVIASDVDRIAEEVARVVDARRS